MRWFVWESLTQEHIKHPLKLSSQIIDCSVLSQNKFPRWPNVFSFSDYQVLPWQGHCTKGELHICGKGMRSHTFQALQLCEQESAVVTRKNTPAALKNQIPNTWNILSSAQVLAPANTLRKNPPSLLYFKSPENFQVAENICSLLSAPCSDFYISVQLPQALSRSSSPNSQLLSKDTAFLGNSNSGRFPLLLEKQDWC